MSSLRVRPTAARRCGRARCGSTRARATARSCARAGRVSLATNVLHAVGRAELVELRAVLADDVVVALAELLADRVELLAEQELALLLVHAFADVVADRLGDLQLGEVVARPRRGRSSTRSDHVDGLEHDRSVVVVELGPQRHRVGQRPGDSIVRSSSGRRRELRSSAISSSMARSSHRRVDGGGATPSMTGSTSANVGPAVVVDDRRDPGTTLDLDDRRRLAGRQVADVGDLRATTARSCSSPPVSAIRPSA